MHRDHLLVEAMVPLVLGGIEDPPWNAAWTSRWTLERRTRRELKAETEDCLKLLISSNGPKEHIRGSKNLQSEKQKLSKSWQRPHCKLIYPQRPPQVCRYQLVMLQARLLLTSRRYLALCAVPGRVGGGKLGQWNLADFASPVGGALDECLSTVHFTSIRSSPLYLFWRGL